MTINPNADYRALVLADAPSEEGMTLIQILNAKGEEIDGLWARLTEDVNESNDIILTSLKDSGWAPVGAMWQQSSSFTVSPTGRRATDTALEALNSYGGENIWQDVIIPIANEAETDAIDEGRSDRFVSDWGQRFDYDYDRKEWVAA